MTLKGLEAEKMAVLLDYETNDDVEDVRRPLSHAGLIKRFLKGQWPTT